MRGSDSDTSNDEKSSPTTELSLSATPQFYFPFPFPASPCRLVLYILEAKTKADVAEGLHKINEASITRFGLLVLS